MDEILLSPIPLDQLGNLIKDSLRTVLSENIQKTPPELPDRCGLLEAIEITGLKQSALYKKTMSGDVPHKKFGKRLVFSRKELEAWMKQRTVGKQSPEEIVTKHLAKVARKKLK